MLNGGACTGLTARSINAREGSASVPGPEEPLRNGRGTVCPLPFHALARWRPLRSGSASSRSIRTNRLDLAESAYVQNRKFLFRVRKADIPTHPIRQVRDLVLRLTAPPDGGHQGACGLPRTEFPVEFIDCRRKEVDSYRLCFTHDCPSRRIDAAGSFRRVKDAPGRSQECEQSLRWPITSG